MTFRAVKIAREVSRRYFRRSSHSLPLIWGGGAAATGAAVLYSLSGEEDHVHVHSQLHLPLNKEMHPVPVNVSRCDDIEEHTLLMGLVDRLKRKGTVQLMQESSSEKGVEDRYKVHWNNPLGKGAYGTVYMASDRASKDKVALKKIPKKFTDDLGFQREMDALLNIRKAGGHPNICSLRENFEEGDHYYISLDLISGGEMFDHLVKMGAYSEADAARLIREIASALAYIHGIGIVHGDLKPENVMLSTNNPSDSVVKLVDFGSSGDLDSPPIGITPAYSPPEVLDENGTARDSMTPSQDMWAMGIMLYIMLTGLHPFDLNGKATDEEIEEIILSGKTPPLRKSPITAHLSESSLDLIEKLMEYNCDKRLTALQMLEHPWVRGETATKEKIEGSHKRLSLYRVYQSRLEATVFRNFLDSATDKGDGGVKQRTSLIETAFRSLDPSNKGYLSRKDLRKLSNKSGHDDGVKHNDKLSLSGFSDLLSSNMKNRYFPMGHVLYREGDTGNHMYFINSGTIEVSTKEGTKAKRTTGDFFGEGALLHPKKIRSATIKCVTPLHAIEISRDYFEKYLSEDSDVKFTLAEKNKARKRGRAKMILRLQNNLTEKDLIKGDVLFKEGAGGRHLYIVEEGSMDVSVQGRKVFVAGPGDVTGEHSLVMGKPRNSTAVCATDHCKVLSMPGRDFYSFLDSTETIGDSIKDICLRRELMKSYVFKYRKPFPTDPRGLRTAFKQIDRSGKGTISLDDIRSILGEMDTTLTESDFSDIFKALNVSGNSGLTFSEFERIYREKEVEGLNG